MTDLNLDTIVKKLKHVLPADRNEYALHEPQFSGKEQTYLIDCLRAGWVSSAGPFVDQFERKLEAFTGVKHAVAVVNGTSALHTCLNLAGVAPGDEVMLPSLTFVATANAVKYCGAIPHFIDSEERTLGLDPVKLGAYLEETAVVRDRACFNSKTDRRIRALIAVHVFGHPADLDVLARICEKFHIELIEDAAESLGSFYKGKHTGNWGKLSALSFNGNKIISTGGGGAVLTNNSALGQKAKHLTTTAKQPHPWNYFHDQVGYNYRLPNINAALGCAQLEQLPNLLQSKRLLAESYQQEFADFRGVAIFKEVEFAQSNYWLNTLILDEVHVQHRDALLKRTNALGIMTRPIWTLLHKLPMYKNCPRMKLTIAGSLEQRVINLPSSPQLLN